MIKGWSSIFHITRGYDVLWVQEFIEGAARLRGTAKALDVWRMETKVEVLFEEVLNLGFARISLVFPCVFFHETRGINWENTPDPYESTRKRGEICDSTINTITCFLNLHPESPCFANPRNVLKGKNPLPVDSEDWHWKMGIAWPCALFVSDV